MSRATTRSPFPWLPMMAICTGLISHSYALSSLFPYIGYMVQYLGVTDDKDEAGFYAGYVSSALMVGRFGSSYFWGRFADRYGRLPVMYISLCSMVVLPLAFGMSTSFYWAIAWRFPYLLPNLVGACIALAGLPMVFFFLHETKPAQAGNGGCYSDGFKPLPTLETDIEDPDVMDKSPAVAMTPLMHANSLDYGQGNDEDNLASAGKDVFASSSSRRITVADDTDDTGEAADTIRLLNETERVLDNSGSERRRLYHAGKCFDARDTEVDAGKWGVGSACWTECLVPIRLLSDRKVRGILFVYGLVSFLKIGFDEVYPLWALSTIANGGLDWTTNEIGKCLSVTGLAMLVFQMVIYPPLIKAVGIQRSQRVSSFVMAPIFMATPPLSLLHDKGWLLNAANVVILCGINIAANTIFSNVALATNNAVDASRRGTLNGISMTTGSLAKAVGPSFFAVVFAWSINRPRPFPLDHQLVFYLMAMLMVVTVWASWDVILIPETGEDSTEEDRVTATTENEAGIELTAHREER